MAKEDTDILTDTLGVVGAEEGQKGLPTPAEMEALEEGREEASGEAAETGGDEEGADKALPLEGIDVDVLQKKVEDKEELSEAEQAALTEIERVAESKPEKTYTIAGKSYTFEEMEKRFREETDNQDTEFSAAGLEKTVDTFVKSQNREAAHVATAEKQKVLAEESRQIAAERQQLEVEKARIETEQLTISRDRVKIEKAKEKLTVKANSTVTEADTLNTETGITDIKKFMEYQAKIQAQEQLEAIAEEEEKISKEEQEINAKLAYASLKTIQLAHPQYRTTDDVLVIAQKLTQHQPVSAEDKAKFLALRLMYQEASTANLPIEDVYESKKLHKQTLPDVAPPTPARPGLKQLNKERTLAQQVAAIKRFKEKVAKNPKLAESIGGGQRGKETRRPAQLMNEEERSVRADRGDPMAKNWWKTPKA